MATTNLFEALVKARPDRGGSEDRITRYAREHVAYIAANFHGQPMEKIPDCHAGYLMFAGAIVCNSCNEGGMRELGITPEQARAIEDLREVCAQAWNRMMEGKPKGEYDRLKAKLDTMI